jgi:hypothetical protein
VSPPSALYSTEEQQSKRKDPPVSLSGFVDVVAIALTTIDAVGYVVDSGLT